MFLSKRNKFDNLHGKIVSHSLSSFYQIYFIKYHIVKTLKLKVVINYKDFRI